MIFMFSICRHLWKKHQKFLIVQLNTLGTDLWEQNLVFEGKTLVRYQIIYLPILTDFYLNSEKYLQRYGIFGDQYIDDLHLDDSTEEQNKSTKRRRITVH